MAAHLKRSIYMKLSPRTKSAMFHQNQLQFNLDVPSLPNNLAARYRNPGPLMIEKLGGEAAAKTESREPREPPVKFTTISEDQLSTAIRLAKLDLKNMLSKRLTSDTIHQPSPQEQRNKKARSKRSPSGRNLRQRADPKSKIRERHADQNQTQQRSIETQTPKAKWRHAKGGLSLRPTNAHGLVLNVPQQDRHSDAHRGGPSSRAPVTPPSKDVALSPDSRQAQEIRRLRLELKTYMKKVEELSVKASQQRADSRKDVEDDEEDPRRAARAAEQASRSARLLYSLQRQVREIQEELDRLGPGKVRHTKKSRALTRLAAAHRGAVRALQSFLHHLPSEMDPGSGLPPHYQELALLIRQLSLCCSQLDVEESGIPEGVLNILEQAKDFQDALSQQTSTPPRPGPRQTSRPDGSPRRRLAFDANPAAIPAAKPQPRAVTSQGHRKHQSDANFKFSNAHRQRVSREIPVKERERYADTPQVTPGPTTVERLRRSVMNNKATPGSPERNEALRAGLEALLRAGGHTQGAARPTRQAPGTMAPGVHVSQPVAKARKPPPAKASAPTSKSLILPVKLKAARERLQHSRLVARDAHFTQETVASKLKHRQPAGQSSDPGTSKPPEEGSPPASAKPAWTPPGSPRSFHKVASPRPPDVAASSEDEDESVQDKEHIPRRRKVVFEVDGESRDGDGAGLNRAGRLDPALMEREVARQAWLDREAARQVKPHDDGRQGDDYPPLPPHWLEQVEKALTDRLRPLIDKAESSAKEQQRLESAARQSLHHQLSQKAMQATSNNADLLSDLLLEDILEDTALEFRRIEASDRLDQQARQLQDAPTVEGMLHSLEQMESVEDEIRRRWKRVEYIHQDDPREDSMQQREAKWMMGTPLDGEFLERFPGSVPTDHTSMKFTKLDNRKSDSNAPSSEPSEDLEVPPQTEQVQVKPSADGYDYVRPPPQDYTRFSREDGEDARKNLPNEPPNSPTRTTLNPSHHLGILQNLLGTEATTSRPDLQHAPASRRDARPTLDRPTFPLFVPSDMMNRIKEHRGRFEHHLKRTSHWAYGTFNPWKLVEEVSDTIVSEIIADVSGEVGDIMGHCVDELYKAEFDMT